MSKLAHYVVMIGHFGLLDQLCFERPLLVFYFDFHVCGGEVVVEGQIGALPAVEIQIMVQLGKFRVDESQRFK